MTTLCTIDEKSRPVGSPRAGKRGGGASSLSLNDIEVALDGGPDFTELKAEALLALDEALKRLAQRSDRQSRVVECRFFGGLSIDETAQALVATNCVFTGGTTRFVNVSAGATASIHFDGNWSGLASVRVSVNTSGPDRDVNGYRLLITRGADPHEQRVTATATVFVLRLAHGAHNVILADVSPNCDVIPNNTVSVSLSSGDTVDVSFQVTCAPATLIAFAMGLDTARDIYRIRSNGAYLERLTHHPAPDLDPAWAPDGSRIAFVSERDGNAEIYVMNANGTDQTRLTRNSVADRMPAWSPDGRQIAFPGGRDGNDEIYVMNDDGSGLVRLTDNPAPDRDPAWSPYGRRIAFVSNRSGPAEVHTMSTSGSKFTRITNLGGEATDLTWSPEGLRIAFTYTSCAFYNCRTVVLVAKPDGTAVTPFITGQRPAWSPDGNRIGYVCRVCESGYYYDYDCKWDGVWVTRTNGRSSVELVSGPVSAISWTR
jgi:WD40 repeat protein